MFELHEAFISDFVNDKPNRNNKEMKYFSETYSSQKLKRAIKLRYTWGTHRLTCISALSSTIASLTLAPAWIVTPAPTYTLGPNYTHTHTHTHTHIYTLNSNTSSNAHYRYKYAHISHNYPVVQINISGYSWKFQSSHTMCHMAINMAMLQHMLSN